MSYANPDAVVSTDWLAAHLDDSAVRVVDGTSFLPNVPRDARAEFEVKHIPGAVLIDIEEVSDHGNPLPHMLPSAEQFAEQVAMLGIGDAHRVIVYDSMGVRTSPRVWWMFRVFGHDDVAVLDGGLPKWEAESRPLASGNGSHPPASFTARLRPEMVRDIAQMIAIQKDHSAQVVDARPKGRFDGIDDEPRPGLPSGHMPWSVNMPVELFVDGHGSILPAATIRDNFAAAGVDIAKPIATTCGSGVAACTASFALYLVGHGIAPVYDGSWTEWAGRDDTEIAR